MRYQIEFKLSTRFHRDVVLRRLREFFESFGINFTITEISEVE